MNSMKIKKGDTVVVLTGKDKGKQGEVKKSIPQAQRVVVEKVNMVKKAMRPTQANPQGGITSIEAPLHVSNVMLVCPECNAAHPREQARERGWQEGPSLQEVWQGHRLSKLSEAPRLAAPRPRRVPRYASSAFHGNSGHLENLARR